MKAVQVRDDDGGRAGVAFGCVERHEEPGWQFNRNINGLSFGLKNGSRFHFDSVTCLIYPFLNFLLVWGISSQTSSGF